MCVKIRHHSVQFRNLRNIDFLMEFSFLTNSIFHTIFVWKFPSFQFPADLSTFTKDILNGKFFVQWIKWYQTTIIITDGPFDSDITNSFSSRSKPSLDNAKQRNLKVRIEKIIPDISISESYRLRLGIVNLSIPVTTELNQKWS